MSRVVIIGGSGHVGAYLVPRLVSAGFKVVSVSRRQRARISRMVRLLCPAKLMRYRCLRTESSIEFASEIPRELGKRFRRPRFPGLPVARDCVYEGRGSAVGVCHRDRVTSGAGQDRPGGGLARRLAIEVGGGAHHSDPVEVNESCVRATLERRQRRVVLLLRGATEASPPATSLRHAPSSRQQAVCRNHQVSDEIVSQIVTLGGAAAADSGYLAR